MMHTGWFGMGWMWIFWLFVIVGGIALVATLARNSANRPTAPGPEEVVKQRYARGEIDRQEYERKLEDLRR